MSPSEMKRLTLYEKLIDVLGEEPAVTLMENLPPGGWDQVASKADIEARRAEVNGQFAQVNAKIDGGFAAVNGQFAAVNGQFAEVNGQFAEVNAKIDGGFAALRGDMGAMEGRMDRRAGRDIRIVVFTTVGAVLAATTPIWVTLLVRPIG